MLNPSLDYLGTTIRVKFSGDCLKEEKITFNHRKIVNIYIVYEIKRSANISSYQTLEDCLFGAVKLTKHVDFDQYKYSGYGMAFDRKGSYSTGDKIGRNIIILTKKNTKFCLSLHYNGENSYLFVNGTEIIKFEPKDSEISRYPLCLGNISKDWPADNMKKTGLQRCVYDFSVYYDAVLVSDILDTHKYLMKKNEIV